MCSLKFNYARRTINPPMKMGLAGYFNTRIWEKVLDDLEVRVAAFQNKDSRALLIQYDLITCPPPMFAMLKDALKQNGLDDVTLLVTATHCHTAPEVRIGRGGYCEDYLPFAVEKTLEACKEALASLEDATMERTMVMESRCCFNRRFWMKDGTVATNPGKLNADIVRPEGEIDPEIPMLRFRSSSGKELVLLSISNHADTTGGNNVSGDWPSWTRRLVEKELSANAMVMPLIGCSGDINHFDVSVAGDQTEPAEAERIGRCYAEAVISALSTFKSAPVTFSCRSKGFDMPGREISDEELAEAHEIMEKYADIEFNQDTAKNLTAEDFAKKSPVVLKYFASNLLNLAANPKSFHFEISYLDFGAGAVMGIPCEPFVATGLLIRREYLCGKTALVAILNNGSGTGYFPNSWNYGRGGYETTPRSNPFSIHAAGIVLKEAQEIIHS